MSNTTALLDRALKMCSPNTDYRLAKTLGISYATISRCRHHGGTLDNKAAFKLAKFIGAKPDEVITMIELDRARRPADKAFWEHIAPRLLPTLLTAALLTSAGGYVTQGRAANTNTVQFIHYAKLRPWGFLRLVGDCAEYPADLPNPSERFLASPEGTG